MITAFLLVFNSARTWDRIVAARRHLLSVFLAFLLPLLLLTCAAEGYGLMRWGKKLPQQVLVEKKFTGRQALFYETLQFTLGLLVVFIGAKMIKSLGETFHGRHTFTQAFTTVAYGLSPVFLLRLLDVVPPLSPWIPWAIGTVLSIAILYHGVPRVMQPDPPHAFGLYLTSAFLLTMISGLARFVTAWWLQGKFKQLNVIAHEIISRLHL